MVERRAKRGPKARDLQCPSCHQRQTAVVTETWSTVSQGRVQIERRLECRACNGHFRSTERVTQTELDRLRVAISNTKTTPWFRGAIEDDLRLRVRKTLWAHEREQIVEAVCQDIENMAATSHREVYPYEEDGETTQLIFKSTIRDAVDRAMAQAADRAETTKARARLRAARVQWALANYGVAGKESPPQNPDPNWPVHIDKRPYFHNAKDIVEWLNATFGIGSKKDVDPPVTHRVRGQFEWAPAGRTVDRARLERVIKSYNPVRDELPHRSEAGPMSIGDGQGVEMADRREANLAHDEGPPLWRDPVPFREEIMDEKVRLALNGRPRASAHVEVVEQWTYWGLSGQRVVRTSQIGTCIAEVLRMLDDVAYLRWVAIGKELSVEDLYEEAVNLIRFPSPQMKVVGTGVPRARMYAAEVSLRDERENGTELDEVEGS